MTTVTVTDVRPGPGGLVVVTCRLQDGTPRRLVLPKKLAGVSQVEWAAKALATLVELQALPA